MPDEEHALLIPVTGLLEVIHVETELHVPATLRARGGKGALIQMDLHRDNHSMGRATWFHESLGPVNVRAREAIEMLTGVHIIINGPLMLADLPPGRIGDIVSVLSRKE